MSQYVSESQNYKNITATTTIETGSGGLLGIFVGTAGGTIKVQDGATTIVNTFTPVGATFYPIPAQYGTSLIVTITGTIDCTVFWS